MRDLFKARQKPKPIGKAQENVHCPFCNGYNTELYSLFGGTLSTSQYYCRDCRVAFERFKWDSETTQ